MDVERILRNTPSTLSVTFYGDTSPIDADSTVTVTIIRPDGTALATNAATQHVGSAGSGQYKYELAPQAVLRKLAVAWTGNFAGVAGTITTYVEIVGGFYFTLYEARNSDKVIASDTVKYSNEILKDARLFVETEFERICDRAFVPRGAYETIAGLNSDSIVLEHPEITKIVSLTVDGIDWTSKPLIASGKQLSLVEGSLFTAASFYAPNIKIEYEYGPAQAPVDIKRAGLKRLRSIVLGQQSTIDERATLMSVPDIGTFSLATPGRGNSFTGYPEIDVVLQDRQWAAGVSFG